jgi:hypothetical protein
MRAGLALVVLGSVVIEDLPPREQVAVSAQVPTVVVGQIADRLEHVPREVHAGFEHHDAALCASAGGSARRGCAKLRKSKAEAWPPPIGRPWTRLAGWR